MKALFFFPLVFALGYSTGVVAEEPVPPAAATPKDKPVLELQKGSVVRVNSTNQQYDFFRPWNKKAPFNRRGIGAVIDGNEVVVAAELVANSNFIELEKPESGERTSARVVAIDHETNLALLRPNEERFLQTLQPLGTDSTVKVGDQLSVIQLEANGTPVSTQALVTSAEVGRYVLEDCSYLLFKMSCPLQYRENSFTLPIVKDHQLAAILLRYDPRSQTVEAISGPVIQHFLREAKNTAYRGFPRIGVQFSSMRDPVLRRYVKLPDAAGGVFVDAVQRNGPAAKAGILPGDILLAIDGKAIDPDGNYIHPIFGKLSVTHLTTTELYCGQTTNVTVFRNGEQKDIPVELFRQPVESYVVDPYVIDRAPRYLVLGGLVFQELSRQYLREWGTNWAKEAPQRFVYYDRFQSELFPEPRKIVFLSQVIPTADTVGYEQLNYLIVNRVNGREIRNLDDLAQAIRAPQNGFQKIEFNEDPRAIYLDAGQAESTAKQLQALYALPALQRL
jgi:S1-C subfamily serine protease